MERTTDQMKSFYEAWLGTQKQLTQQWMQGMNNLQQQMTGNFQEQGKQLYGQVADQQVSMYKQWMESVQRAQQGVASLMGLPTMAAMPGFAMTEQGFNAMRDMWEQQMKAFGMPSVATSQQDMMGNFGKLRSDMLGQVFGMYDNWTNLYRHSAEAMGRMQQDLLKNAKPGMPKEAADFAARSTEAYLKVLEFWMPVMKQMQEKTLTPEQFQQMLHPSRYKEVMDRVFSFASAENVQQFNTQMSKLVEGLSGNAQHTAKRYQEMLERHSQLLPELMAGDPQAAVKIYENLYDAYQKNLDPMLKASLGGRDAEAIGIVKDMMAKYADYMGRVSQFQYKVYVTGQKTLEGVADKAYKAYQKSHEAGSFNEFFQQWAAANETAFRDLFQAEEYTHVQNDLMNVGMEIRTDFQRLMEIMMADYPVVPRSEMNEMAKTVNDLKARLYELEKALGKNGATDAAEAPAAKRPVAAKK